MRKIDQQQFNQIIKTAKVKKRLRQELRFGASTNETSADNWEQREMIAVSDRSTNEGVLMIQN